VLVSYIIIALMMEAASTSETSVNFYQTTRRNIPEDDSHHLERFTPMELTYFPNAFFIFSVRHLA
jgi:hypothetical protein